VIILDTHIWLWWLNKAPQISKNQLEKIEQSIEVGVSAISLFEVSWLATHNRIELNCPKDEWFDKALIGSNIQLMPITPAIASRAAELPEHHKDPQDRLIISTAIINDALLLSSDSKFKLYTELDGKLI